MHVIKGGKSLRCGYSTGTCAAAAAKAAMMGLLNYFPFSVDIKTPDGIVIDVKVEDCYREGGFAFAGIKKDAGDDIDVTDGMMIYARVNKREDGIVSIDGGEGIGRFREDGPFGRKGEAAINKVPRRMIEDSVREVYQGGADVLIFAPEGKKIAEKTFNPKLGIEGGISILGTKGLVFPMSDYALVKSIYMELDYVRTKSDSVILTPGNYGEEYAKKLGLEGEIVKISNYFGEVLLYAVEIGFNNITIVGHIGKMCKLSIGAFNTSSRVIDSRMEAFIYYLAKMGYSYDLMAEVETFKTAEEAAEFLIKLGYVDVLEEMRKGIIDRLKRYIKKDHVNLEVYIYTFGMMR